MNLIECVDRVDFEPLGLLMTEESYNVIEKLFKEYCKDWHNRDEEDKTDYLNVDEFCEFLAERGVEAKRVFAEVIYS